MTSIRWKVWEWASWLAWWICPDKRSLNLMYKHGTIGFLAAQQAAKATP